MNKKSLCQKDVAGLFPPLPDEINKGGMGRVLVVCGSYDPSGLSMSGAAYFAAKAAYRCGAGIVEIFTPRENYAVLAALVPEAVFSLYGYDESCDAVASRLKNSIAKSDSVVLGCGLGKSELSKALLRTALESIFCPLVLDADGLNILSENEELWDCLSEEQGARTVITPHPGEMARLCGLNISEIIADSVNVACEYAKSRGVVCLLKGHNTVITDGESSYINESGNPGMATAGMGDVLAGIIGALLARCESASDNSQKGILLRAAAGAFLHGRTGDLIAEKIGHYSLNSSDLLAEIPAAIRSFFG